MAAHGGNAIVVPGLSVESAAKGADACGAVGVERARAGDQAAGPVECALEIKSRGRRQRAADQVYGRPGRRERMGGAEGLCPAVELQRPGAGEADAAIEVAVDRRFE